MAIDLDTATDEEFEKYMEDTLAKGEEPGEEVEEVEIDDSTEEEETQEIEEDEELEQPTEDNSEESDDLVEDEVDEAETDEDSDETEDTSESEEAEQSEDVEDEATETETTSQQVHRIRANGTDFEFTTEELLALAPKAMDYTRKTKELAPWRKTISALKENNLGHEDINTLIDVMKGDKTAIQAILKRAEIDPLELDLDDSNEYVPNDYGKNPNVLDVEDITSEISQDREFVITQDVLTNRWDDASREEFAKDPQLIKALHADVKTGEYDKIAPLATKMKLFGDGKLSDLEYYRLAAREVYSKEAIAKQEAEANAAKQAEVERVKKAEAKRKAKAKTAKKAKKATVSNSKGSKDVIDYLDADSMSDEEFSAMMEKEIRKK